MASTISFQNAGKSVGIYLHQTKTAHLCKVTGQEIKTCRISHRKNNVALRPLSIQDVKSVLKYV